MNGLRLGSNADSLVVDYVYPGTVDIHVVHGITLTTTGKDAREVRLGRLRGQQTAADVLDDRLWAWEPNTAAKAQAWVKHVLVVDAFNERQSYEFEGQLVIVGHGLPPRAAEHALYTAGFRSSLATWRAAATPERRARLPDLLRSLGGDKSTTQTTYPTATASELKERAQHVWMRWHALFRTDLEVGGRTYTVRRRPELRDSDLAIELRHASSKSEWTIRFDVASHPFLYGVIVDVGGQTLRREALAWEDFPALADEVSAALSAQKKGQRASTVPAKAPVEAPASRLEHARSVLETLALPAKKHAYYLRRVEEAIEEGRAWAPVVARARRAAEKLAGTKRPATKRPAPMPRTSPPARPPAVDTAIDSFNREPIWRAEKLRARANGYVLAIYPEGKDTAVASVDVLHGDVDEIRWLDDRLTPQDRDNITERLGRALWEAHDDEDEEDDDDDDAQPRPSPLQDLIDLMDRRSIALGVRSVRTADVPPKDRYRHIAKALHDLAQPRGPGADELQRWLEMEDLFTAGEVLGQARGSKLLPARPLMHDLWSGVFEALTLADVTGRPGALVVPDEALFTEEDSDFVLERVREGGHFIVRRIRVRALTRDEETGTTVIEDPTDRLAPGASVHHAERPASFYAQLYGKLGAFQADLERAPRILEDVRTLLYWTAVMLEAPLCQGEAKARAAAAFAQAKAYHDTARQTLLEGRSVDAVRRMHEAMRRISSAAAEFARSCAEGQIEIGITPPPQLPVRPEDQAAIEGRD
ncbi:MAG: hypothetical protein H0T76_22060 [Nannocystis sp.]|nr:hypothetical protein [Nannocystis sp.]